MERHAPRGKNHLLTTCGAQRLSGPLKDTMAACLQCGACTDICSAGVDVRKLIHECRRDHPVYSHLSMWFIKALGRASLHPEVIRGIASIPSGAGIAGRLAQLLVMEKGRHRPFIPAPSKRPLLSRQGVAEFFRRLNREELKRPAPHGVKNVGIFTGCLHNFIYPETVNAMARWFHAELSIEQGQTCCGLPAFSSGDIGQAVSTARHNINVLGKSLPDIILTGCISCAGMIKRWQELPGLSENERRSAEEISFRTREFAEFIMEFDLLPDRLSQRGLITTHVPCHERFSDNVSSGVNALAEATAGDNFVQSADQCCGHGGSFGISFPTISRGILERRMDSIAETGAHTVVTNCSGCLMQLGYGAEIMRRKGCERIPAVLHVAEIIDL